MPKIKILELSHQAPPAQSLSPNFIRGLTKKREFLSHKDILAHYNMWASDADIVRTSSAPRFTLQVVRLVVKVGKVVSTINIPNYFTYDGESIGFAQKFNYRGSRIAALIHDFLYYVQKFSKRICDKIMLKIQLMREVPKMVAYAVHFGLVLFGHKAYNQYNKY